MRHTFGRGWQERDSKAGIYIVFYVIYFSSTSLHYKKKAEYFMI